MVLTPQRESLIGVIQQLPPGEAGKVPRWAQQLGQLAGGDPIEWSDSWSEEDLADAARASLQRFDHEEHKMGDVVIWPLSGAQLTNAR